MNYTVIDNHVTILQRLRSCFYLLWPSETYFQALEDMPNFVGRSVPLLLAATVIEAIIMHFKGRRKDCRLNEILFNWSQTAMYDGFNNFLFRGVEFSLYIWVYENFRFFTFDWNSPVTWLVTLLSVEFFNYWWHRCAHEIAIMWAAHELHHSSEDFNMGTAFRNNSTMRMFRWIFFVPLAPFGLPVAVMWTHVTLGALFNTFAHSALTPKVSKVLPGVGHFIEFLFVTPSHHRVHHGSNRYCIDKNYGQYLIIWDRLFGTFEEEREDEPITYGTLSQEKTKNLAYVQVSSFIKLKEKVASVKGFGNKVRALLYGPGWSPGKPRLGDPTEIPDVRGRMKWDVTIPTGINVYLIVNIIATMLIYVHVMERIKLTSSLVHFVTLIYIFYSFTTLGMIYDGQLPGIYLELARILLFYVISVQFPSILVSFNLKMFLFWLQTIDFFAIIPLASMNFFANEPKINKKKM